MPQYILRKLPSELWDRVQQRAAAEGWPLRALILQLLEAYAAGRIVPFFGFYCASCGTKFDSRDGMYQNEKGQWNHDEEGGMSCCGPVLECQQKLQTQGRIS